MCLSVHKEFKNPYFISVLRLVCKLQAFACIVVMEEFIPLAC